ncbi:hypothetical protein LB566_13865 [Mesorhizobium sp. CA13]|nr:hypothetical protein [Mesorhizobium sp. CA13]MBZ9854891.1 hypothetical protein [Mesorhizobium sp. CA13]
MRRIVQRRERGDIDGAIRAMHFDEAALLPLDGAAIAIVRFYAALSR